jgi:hypothetical protein
LQRHVERFEERTVRVGDLREGEAVTFDEVLEVRIGPSPGDPDDGYWQLCLDRFDRSGFSVARPSIGSPEPEEDGLTGEVGKVDLCAADGRDDLLPVGKAPGRDCGDRAPRVGRRRGAGGIAAAAAEKRDGGG